MKSFIEKLFAAAKEAGFSAAEAFVVESESFKAVSTQQEITDYTSEQTRGLGFRAMLNGRMGYASTEAFDDAAVDMLVRGAMDSATLCEDPSEQFLFDGKAPDPAMDLHHPALDAVPPESKLAFVLNMEKAAKAYDPRVEQVGYDTIVTGKQTVRLVNTLGLDKSYTENYCGAYLQPVAHEGDSTVTAMDILFARDFDVLDAERLGRSAAKLAVDALHAAPVPSGNYRALIENVAMTDLLSTFASVFSAETAQKDLSLLKGKIGQQIAADCVTLVDDPLRADGLASRPFDAEGVPSAKHVVVENGTFRTFLHNLKTARKDGVATTGNASRAGYASSVRVSPSNFYLEPGRRTLNEMMQTVGEGLLITEVEGLHAGANAVSGDFSLLAKGYRIIDGKRGAPVEQITVAGNFFDLLRNIRELGSDLRFPQGGMGSPSVDAGTLAVAGRDA